MYLINLCYCCARACNSKMYLRSEPKRKPLTKCIRLTMRKKAVHFSLCRNADLSKCSASVPHLRFISIAPFHIPTHAYTAQCTQYRHRNTYKHTYTFSYSHTINCYRSSIIQLLFKWSEHFHFYYSF